ncbi:MAG: Nif11-like leader peptide family RiPP precursor [Selenomonas sp.]|nr:Nif11-like leader peptide family RiPP precursor [Selenomonas sp.]
MAKLDELMEKMKDEAFAKKFEGCKSTEDFVAVAKKEGYDISIEDAESITNDLSDDDLAKIAGGLGLVHKPNK